MGQQGFMSMSGNKVLTNKKRHFKVSEIYLWWTGYHLNIESSKTIAPLWWMYVSISTRSRWNDTYVTPAYCRSLSAAAACVGCSITCYSSSSSDDEEVRTLTNMAAVGGARGQGQLHRRQKQLEMLEKFEKRLKTHKIQCQVIFRCLYYMGHVSMSVLWRWHINVCVV